MPKQITKAMLPSYDPRVHTLLLCTACGAEYSANPADFFYHEDNHVFRCCHRNMRLVRKRTVYEDVATEKH